MDDSGVKTAAENLLDAADQACEALDPALTTLLEIAADCKQTGAARVSACKVLIDVAVKLDSYSKTADRQERSLSKLDAYLQQFYELADSGDGEDESDVDSYDEE